MKLTYVMIAVFGEKQIFFFLMVNFGIHMLLSSLSTTVINCLVYLLIITASKKYGQISQRMSVCNNDDILIFPTTLTFLSVTIP